MTKKPSLAETHPGLAAEALDWNPFRKNVSSRALVWWQCPEGHHYSESIVERVKNGGSCSYCIIKSPRKRAAERSQITKLQKQKNLEERHWTRLYPKIAKQADGWDPTTIKNGSNIKKSGSVLDDITSECQLKIESNIKSNINSVALSVKNGDHDVFLYLN